MQQMSALALLRVLAGAGPVVGTNCVRCVQECCDAVERHCRDPLCEPFNPASGFSEPVIKIEAYGLLKVLQNDIYR
jgi:hypothetical protein